MATKYVITGGGNWTGSIWNTASNQATSNTTAPTNADIAKLDQYSGQVTVNATTCVCKDLDCTGYANTITYTAGQTITVGSSGSGTVTLGGTIAGTGLLSLVAGTCAFAGNSKTLTGGLTLTGTTVTMTGYVQVNGTFTYNGTSLLNTGTVKINGGYNLGSKATLTGTGTIEFVGTTAPTATTFALNVILNSGAGTMVTPANMSFSKILTYTSGTYNQSTNSTIWNISNGATLNTDGLLLRQVYIVSGTVTLGTDCQITNFYPGSFTLVGAYIMTVSKFRIGSTSTLSYTSGGTWTFDVGMTFNISDYLYIAGNLPFIHTFQSSSAGTPVTWTYNGMLSNCQVANASFIDIDASSEMRIHAINSTVLRSPNIVQVRNSDLYGTGVALKTINRKRTFYV